MIKAIALFITTIGLGACAHTPSAQPWCTQVMTQNIHLGDEVPVGILNIRLENVDEAMRMLKDKRVVEVSPRVASRLAGTPFKVEVMYFLVRSGVFAKPGSSLKEINAQLQFVNSRTFRWMQNDQRMTILNLQSIKGESQLYDFPLLMETIVSPAVVQSYCLARG